MRILLLFAIRSEVTAHLFTFAHGHELSGCVRADAYTVDPEGLHLLTCNKGPGRVRLHNDMVRAWHSLMILTGLRAMVEQRGLYPDQRRPDIVVADFSGGRELQLDFSATHPCLPTNLNLTSRDPVAAERAREEASLQRQQRPP